jgi:nuclear pore complex protein Nup93
MTDFQDLLQDAEHMKSQIDQENVGMPRLQRTLAQLFEAGRHKLQKTGQYTSNDSNEINASILLAGKGVDAPRLTQAIDNLNFSSTSTSNGQSGEQSRYDQSQYDGPIGSLEQLRDTDLQTFLKSEKETALISVIEETKQRTMEDIEEFYSTSSDIEWEKQKEKIMHELLGSFNTDISMNIGGSSIF